MSFQRAAWGALLLLTACDSAPVEPPSPRGTPTKSVETAAVSPAAVDTATPNAPPQPRRTDIKPGEMVRIPEGVFTMGAQTQEGDALPLRKVRVSAFSIDVTEVTNAELEAFAKAEHYLTTAERRPSPADFPGVPADKLVPGSLVLIAPAAREGASPGNWWRWVPGADFRHPEGPASNIVGKEQHPAVHVSWYDAVAFCKWKGKRLLTEAEWEYAARGGLDQKRFTWGDAPQAKGDFRANTFQGDFPFTNSQEDGYLTTAPVASFPPNGYGLYDMSGNVWEWVADNYRPDTYKNAADTDPRGPKDSFDPSEPGVPKKVQRGGSFLCADSYCMRYMPGGRGKSSPDSSHMHVGFRCGK